MWKKACRLLIILALGGTFFGGAVTEAALYTPYTGISVTPGEVVEYSVEVINNGSSIQNATFEMDLPENWSYTLTANGREIQELSVKPNESQEVNLEVEVPLEIEKGTYEFELVARESDGVSTLPLTVTVTEQGTFATELTTEQPNMEGNADSTFEFQAELRNRTADNQHYALSSGAPRGWDVQFTSDGDNVTSVTLDPNTSKELEVNVTPPENVKAGTYTIPVKAATTSTSAEQEFEVVISGTYGLELSTPNGVLSTDVTAGGEKTVQLLLTNTGTDTLSDVQLTASTPSDWEVEFENSTVNAIEPEDSVTVNATIKASENAIAGDYMIGITAEAPEATSEADFRVTVKTSMWWGFIGVIIIVGVIAGIYYLFRTYGRR